MGLTILKGASWEALWPYLNEAARAWNDATKYGAYFELFFFLMEHEPELTEPHVRTESLFLHVPFLAQL